jgi:hypothetical protein
MSWKNPCVYSIYGGDSNRENDFFDLFFVPDSESGWITHILHGAVFATKNAAPYPAQIADRG